MVSNLLSKALSMVRFYMLKNKNISHSKELFLSLLKKNKIIPSKFHYDYKGSKYFEKITKTKEYYITRIEKNILKKISKEIDFIFGEDLTFVEFGSGSIEKISILINNNVKYYIPLDISLNFIKKSSKKLQKLFSYLKIIPKYCDYINYINLPKNTTNTKIGFFLGSSIGNFYNRQEKKFLKNAKKTLGKKNFMFVGVDLIKEIKILEKAYNDKRKFTEKFNLNLLNVINKKLKIKIKLNDFKYISTYNKKKKCMENFIISKKNQSFDIKNQKIYFKKNEKIQTEISNKFTISKFKSIIKATGWKLKKYWTDQKKYYAVFLLES